jgi:hypothetical protein
MVKRWPLVRIVRITYSSARGACFQIRTLDDVLSRASAHDDRTFVD